MNQNQWLWFKLPWHSHDFSLSVFCKFSTKTSAWQTVGNQSVLVFFSIESFQPTLFVIFCWQTFEFVNYRSGQPKSKTHETDSESDGFWARKKRAWSSMISTRTFRECYQRCVPCWASVWIGPCHIFFFKSPFRWVNDAYFITYTRVPVKCPCRFKTWKLLSRNVLKFAYKIELITHLGQSSLRSFRMIPFLPQLEQLITSKPKSNCFRFETLNEIISGGIWKNCEIVKMVARKEGIRR